MESKKVFTKQMLMEECGVISVGYNQFERCVYKEKQGKTVYTTTVPTIAITKSKNGEWANYIGLQVSLYNYKTKKYVNMPFSKLVYIWHNDECPMGVVVDHIDTNPMNNKPDNLRLLKQDSNLKDNRKDWRRFPLKEVKGKSIPELDQMIR